MVYGNKFEGFAIRLRLGSHFWDTDAGARFRQTVNEKQGGGSVSTRGAFD
jgi:hypothetical protein